MSCLNSWLRFDQINMKPLCNESDKIDAEKKKISEELKQQKKLVSKKLITLTKTSQFYSCFIPYKDIIVLFSCLF